MNIRKVAAELTSSVFLLLCTLTISTSSSVRDSDDSYDHYRSSVPSFLPVPTNITVHEGETAYMRCRLHNLGPKLVVWRKANDESPLTLGKTVFTPNKNVDVELEDITENETRCDLIIKNVSQREAGVYSCQVAAINNYTLNITLNVLDPVEYEPELKLTGTTFVSLLDDIHLTCNATGSTTAPDAVDWFYNGEHISEVKGPRFDGRLVILNSKPVPGRTLISELIIKRAKMTDGGTYVCRLTKELTDDFKVNVLDDRKKQRERGMPEYEDKSSYNTMHARDTSKSAASSTQINTTLTLILCIILAANVR